MPLATLNGQIVTVQAGGDSASDHRTQTQEFSHAPGPVDFGSFKVSIVSGLTLTIGQGAAFIRSPNDLTLYRVSQQGTNATLTLSTADATNPRIDQIVLRVYDDAVDGSGLYQATVETINGTPSSGATLDNRTGAPDPRTALVNANAYLLLADVLVPAGSSTCTIRNRRPWGQYGSPPPLALGGGAYSIDAVTFIPHPGMSVGSQEFLGTDIASTQSAALMYLPRAIAATNIRWAYYLAVNAHPTAQFKVAFFDASGRYIADSGTITWVGSPGNTIRPVQALTLPYSGYIFDVGYYWVMMCNGTAFSGSDEAHGQGVMSGSPSFGSNGIPVSTVNSYVASPSGALTVPLAINAAGNTFVDMGVTGVNLANSPVPLVTLSN